jgi:hypothetical protein
MRGEEEVGAAADPGGAFFQVLCVEGGGDGVAQIRPARFCELGELRRIGFFRGPGGVARGEQRQQRESNTSECNRDCTTHQSAPGPL